RGYTYEHALWGGERCYTVSPSDTAPALVALDAQVETFDPSTKELRKQLLADVFALPSFDITSMHKLKSGEILTNIELPTAGGSVRSAFRKAAMRQSWDFALTSVAVVAQVDGDVCREAKIVLGAVAPIPWRARAAEDTLRGAKLRERIEDAVRASVHGAEPL